MSKLLSKKRTESEITQSAAETDVSYSKFFLEPDCVGKRISFARQGYIFKNSLQDGQTDSLQRN